MKLELISNGTDIVFCLHNTSSNRLFVSMQPVINTQKSVVFSINVKIGQRLFVCEAGLSRTDNIVCTYTHTLCACAPMYWSHVLYPHRGCWFKPQAQLRKEDKYSSFQGPGLNRSLSRYTVLYLHVQCCENICAPRNTKTLLDKDSKLGAVWNCTSLKLNFESKRNSIRNMAVCAWMWTFLYN